MHWEMVLLFLLSGSFCKTLYWAFLKRLKNLLPKPSGVFLWKIKLWVQFLLNTLDNSDFLSLHVSVVAKYRCSQFLIYWHTSIYNILWVSFRYLLYLTLCPLPYTGYWLFVPFLIFSFSISLTKELLSIVLIFSKKLKGIPIL